MLRDPSPSTASGEMAHEDPSQARRGLVLLVALGSASAARGCGPRPALKDGNKDYKEENFKKAIDDYERRRASSIPNFAEAWFYLGSSHQALYRPGKDAPENKQHLEEAIEAYEKSLEVNKADSDNQQEGASINTLAALTGIYSDDPYNGTTTKRRQVRAAAGGRQPERPQEPLRDGQPLREVRQDRRGGGDVQEGGRAEPERRQGLRGPGRLLQQAALGRGRRALDRGQRQAAAREVRPGDRRSSRSAPTRRPTTRAATRRSRRFYWDKAYRDPLLTDEQKNAYADKGLDAVDKALGLKPDYFEAVIYKGLLYRVKARSPATRSCARSTWRRRAAAEAGPGPAQGGGRRSAGPPTVPPEAPPLPSPGSTPGGSAARDAPDAVRGRPPAGPLCSPRPAARHPISTAERGSVRRSCPWTLCAGGFADPRSERERRQD